jgi:SAM-dependent methyltransferase
MTDDLPPRFTRLTFHGPLSEARAARIVGRLARTRPATVLDIGCGWGELMLRILAAVPGAAGTGIDLSDADLARGRDNATARGLAQRVSFVEESAVRTARAGRPGLMRRRHPRPQRGQAAAAHPGRAARATPDLPGLIDLAITAGFRPKWIETASLEEWDDFESGSMADAEEWLADHHDHPLAGETRKMADDHLSVWLRASRGLLGVACLTLIPLP